MGDQPIGPEWRSPATKVVGRRPLRAVYRPADLPVPHYRLSPEQIANPNFAPRIPEGRLADLAELDKPKLRGLSPQDSLILRAAITDAMIHPDRAHLSALIPWHEPDAQQQRVPTSRDLLSCTTAPGQCDLILLSAPSPTPPPPTAYDDAYAALTQGRAELHPSPYARAAPPNPDPVPLRPTRLLIVEIKPNAGYVALGQALAYHFYWNLRFRDRWPARPAILTDVPRPYLPQVAAAYGVDLLILARLLIEPPNYPT